MHVVRRVLLAFSLALALLIGQQAAALHDLGHAVDRIAHKGSLPFGNTCDECFACAQLSGAVSPSLPAIPPVVLPDGAPRDTDCTSASLPTRFAFLSRGPPFLL
ncbi:MAG TPA: hypothetical protein VN782_08730 [Usitatibacter sp.]|nr:hypothetical protein [Usitatibacter sp.]